MIEIYDLQLFSRVSPFMACEKLTDETNDLCTVIV